MITSLRQSKLFAKPIKETPSDEDSINAKLLIRAGFIRKLMAGTYSFLPLGLRVLTKIENIIREEMNAIGGQEILMPALQPAEPWKQTGRWDKIAEILFRFKGAAERELTLGPTHEEIVTPLIGGFINSYRDLPLSVYQIQTKYRNELRAKSGLLRGREFRMKDMYSFHSSETDLDSYYEIAHQAYLKILERVGLAGLTYKTYASGGDFSKYSHEYQTVTEHGEDTIYLCEKCKVAVNREIIEDMKNACPECGGGNLKPSKAIEVGNIFKLMTRFSDDFNLSYHDEHGQVQNRIYMGCYGIGSTRLMGTIVEVSHDQNGIVWPMQVAPFTVHLVSLAKNEVERHQAEHILETLNSNGLEVLYDDRNDISPGIKFAESDLIGIPLRIIVSTKTLASGSVEIKERKSDIAQTVKTENLVQYIFDRIRKP